MKRKILGKNCGEKEIFGEEYSKISGKLFGGIIAEITKDAVKALTAHLEEEDKKNSFIRLSFVKESGGIVCILSFDSEYRFTDRITELCGMRVVFDSRFEGLCPYLVIDHDAERGYTVKQLAHNKSGKCPCCTY